MNLSLNIVNQRITVEKVNCTITVGGNKKMSRYDKGEH